LPDSRLDYENMDALVADVLDVAADHLLNKRPELAAQACRSVLDVRPGHGLALLLLGSARLALGDLETAESELRGAVAVRPDIPEAWRCLGLVLRRMGRSDQAKECFERAYALSAPYPEALVGLAETLRRLGRLGEAESHLRQALKARPDYPQARRDLASILLLQGRLQEALEALEAIAGQDPEAGLLAGRILHELGRNREAADAYRRTLALAPNSPRAALALAGLEGRASAPEAPQDIGRRFDGGAAAYDAQLLRGLRYRGHVLVAEALQSVLAPRQDFSVLDAGCGTGLLGPLLRPLAGRLTGLDVSGRMLDRARSGGAYDELVQAEILEFAHDNPDRYEVLAAADLLCYLGDLEPVLAGLARCLAPGGVLAATLERLAAGEFAPGPSRRFAHSEAHLRRAASRSRLQVLRLGRDWLRFEGQRKVDGIICVLAKPSCQAAPECFPS
jgi:predicted TPR repeat methyltransferase/TolA-binding protein